MTGPFVNTALLRPLDSVNSHVCKICVSMGSCGEMSRICSVAHSYVASSRSFLEKSFSNGEDAGCFRVVDVLACGAGVLSIFANVSYLFDVCTL